MRFDDTNPAKENAEFEKVYTFCMVTRKWSQKNTEFDSTVYNGLGSVGWV